ncbi:MAG TPA: class I SAM-dependent methyltransferase [Chthoniobacter sp.]|nr:class I SAM-dependent methyltransferase [Chthoniobacter sp.]
MEPLSKNPPFLHYESSREELRRMQIDFPQRDWEFRYLMGCMAAMQPRNLVEVGTREGGSLFMLSRVLPPGSTIISVDLPGSAWGYSSSGVKKRQVAERLRSDGFIIHLVERDSSAPETATEVQRLLGGDPIEALFLDGDHSFAGVLADFRNYQPLMKADAPLIFHDIVHSPKTPRVEVHYLWRVLKALAPHVEFIESDNAGWGIGVATNTGLLQGYDLRQEEAAQRGLV